MADSERQPDSVIGEQPSPDTSDVGPVVGEPNSGGIAIELTADTSGDSNGQRGRGRNARATTGSDYDGEPTPTPIREDAPLRSTPRRRANRAEDAGNAVGGLITLTSAMLAHNFGDIWMVSEQEANALGAAAIKCLSHVPDAVIPTKQLSLSLDLIALAGAMGAVFGSRYIAWRRQKAIGLTDEQMAALVNMAARRNGASPTPTGAAAPNPMEGDLELGAPETGG